MYNCATSNMRCFISIMCTYNVSASSHVTFTLLYPLNSHELYKKNLLFRSHPRGLVYAAAVSLVLIGHIRTTCRPKPYSPPPPPPYLSPTPDRDGKRTGVGRGGAAAGHLLPPMLRPHSLTALTPHICQKPLAYLIGHPSIESTPLSEPWIQRLARL